MVSHHSSLDFELLSPLIPEAGFVVYDKSGSYRGPCRRIPNHGREGSTYLHHIVENYADLADRTLFIQDDVLAHRTSLLFFVAEVISDRSDFHQYPCTWNGGESPYVRTITDGVCDLHTLGRNDLIRVACEELHIDLPREYTTDTCAFFSVSRNRIHSRSVDFYGRIREWALRRPEHEYALEHMWTLVFGVPSL